MVTYFTQVQCSPQAFAIKDFDRTLLEVIMWMHKLANALIAGSSGVGSRPNIELDLESFQSLDIFYHMRM